MNLTILTVGTRGDVQPYIALGAGLQRAGFTVTIATSQRYEAEILKRGIKHIPFHVDPLEMMESGEGRDALTSGKSALRLMKELRPLQIQMLNDGWAAAQDADAILYHPKAMSGYHIAEKRGIPGFLCIPLPFFSPTRAFPNPIFPPALKLGGAFNRMSYGLLHHAMSESLRGLTNSWRKETLELPPRPFLANELILRGQPVPRLYAYSQHVLPRPDDWDSSTVVTGYWFLDSLDDWQPPADLLAFLEQGAPPVYAGFGSMAGRDAAKVTEIVLAALKKSGQRGVLALGAGGMVVTSASENVFVLNNAPHDWLFPRMAAVVHHGGAGTTAAGLRAGKPSVICPFFGDQPFWGKCVANLGVGPEPIRQKHLTVERLTSAIHRSVTDQQMNQRVTLLGEKIRAEDGVARAVEYIQSRLS